MKKNLIFVGALLLSAHTFAQQHNETEIEQVTIARKIPQQLHETGKNVTLVTQKDLQKYQGQTLNDVLNSVAGFQITGNENNQSEPRTMRVRGGTNANVLVLLDGVPLKDVSGLSFTVADLRLIALENVESIEVLNGASSVLYGSNATVSVINIKTKQQAKKEIEGLVSARGGSFGTFSQDATVRGNFGRGFHYQLSGFNEKSDGMSAANGPSTFDKDGWEKQNVATTFGFNGKNFEVSANAGWNHQLYQYDAGAFADSNQRGNDKQFYTGANAGYHYKNGNLALNVRYSDTDRTYQDLVDGGYQDQYDYKGRDFFAELYNTYTFTNYLDVVAGVQYETQKMQYSSLPWGGTALENVLVFANTDISSFDVFAKAALHYEGFHLDAGTRYTDHSKFGGHWVYSVNPYFLKDTGTMYYKLGYSFATAFIAPTLYQNFGALPYTVPNFDLKPETNQSHEIDLDFGTSDHRFSFTAGLFRRQERDAIASTVLDAKKYLYQYSNVGENKVKGVELGFKYRPVEYLAFGGNFSYVEKDNAATMQRQPKQRINSFLEIDPWPATKIYLSHQFVGSRADAYYDYSTYKALQVVDKSYQLFNLNISQKIYRNIDAFLNVGNLFNISYVDMVGYTTKPRNYTFGVSYRF